MIFLIVVASFDTLSIQNVMEIAYNRRSLKIDESRYVQTKQDVNTYCGKSKPYHIYHGKQLSTLSYVNKKDKNSLKKGNWLTDNCINAFFEIMQVWARINSMKIGCISSHFFSKIEQNNWEETKNYIKPGSSNCHSGWQSKASVSLDEDLLLFPFHCLNGSHWSLIARYRLQTESNTPLIKFVLMDSAFQKNTLTLAQDLVFHTPMCENNQSISIDSYRKTHWIYIPSLRQNEVECGARTCLHAYLLLKTFYESNGKIPSNKFMESYKHLCNGRVLRKWISDILINGHMIDPLDIYKQSMK